MIPRECHRMRRMNCRQAPHEHNTGPGGTGNRVRISGYEEWQLDKDGLIGNSKGRFDSAKYDRQLKHGAEGP